MGFLKSVKSACTSASQFIDKKYTAALSSHRGRNYVELYGVNKEDTQEDALTRDGVLPQGFERRSNSFKDNYLNSRKAIQATNTNRFFVGQWGHINKLTFATDFEVNDVSTAGTWDCTKMWATKSAENIGNSFGAGYDVTQKGARYLAQKVLQSMDDSYFAHQYIGRPIATLIRVVGFVAAIAVGVVAAALNTAKALLVGTLKALGIIPLTLSLLKLCGMPDMPDMPDLPDKLAH